MNRKVDIYLEQLNLWQDEITLLRNIILKCGLKEEFKWMHPCYTFNGKNIVLMHEFKQYCALLFHKGALLNDPENILVQQTENTQSARQIRFTNTQEIIKHSTLIEQYIYEAIEIEKAGVKAPKKSLAEFDIPEELKHKFQEDSAFEIAFKKLTPGRQKGYLLHFSKPKQSTTRTSRIDKNIQRILDGYGLNDCVCGLSKRMPNCDGSHKQLEH